MHLIYVDESGDDGLSKNRNYPAGQTPTQFYIKTALIIHDWKWQSNMKKIQALRNHLQLPAHVEFHATVIYKGKKRKWNKLGKRIDVETWWSQNYPKKDDRIDILKKIYNKIKALDVTLLYVAIDKSKIIKKSLMKNEIKNISWEYLIERINLVLKENEDHCGMLISDAIENKIEKEHREFVKVLHHQSAHIDSKRFIETILFESSESSDFLQMVDLCAYALGRKLNNNDDSFHKIIESKIFEYDSSLRNSGLKIWP